MGDNTTGKDKTTKHVRRKQAKDKNVNNQAKFKKLRVYDELKELYVRTAKEITDRYLKIGAILSVHKTKLTPEMTEMGNGVLATIKTEIIPLLSSISTKHSKFTPGTEKDGKAVKPEMVFTEGKLRNRDKTSMEYQDELMDVIHIENEYIKLNHKLATITNTALLDLVVFIGGKDNIPADLKESVEGVKKLDEVLGTMIEQANVDAILDDIQEEPEVSMEDDTPIEATIVEENKEDK